MSVPAHSQRGFTLIELVIALTIFALVSVMAVSGFWSVQRTYEHVDAKGDELAKLQMALTMLGRDFAQSVARGIRDDFGDPRPAMEGGSTGLGRIIEFTRTGLTNPTGQARSSLERVGYGILEGKLTRVSWPTLDRAQGSEPQEMMLLDKVDSLELRFLDPAFNWQDQWPPVVPNGTPPALPRAVEVKLKLEGWGTLLRIFRIPGEAPPSNAIPNPNPNAN